MRMMQLGLVLVVVCLSAQGQSKDYTPLFDGKTLNGWEALPGGNWSVVDGMIVGTQEASEKRHGQLVSTKQYGNFILKLKYQALEGNSGVYFRVEKINHAVAVKGFQAEVDARGNDVGGLYETMGRSWVVKPSGEQIAKFYKLKEWNDMTVAAVGGDITVAVNGIVTAQLKNDPGRADGFIALQLHGGQKMDVRYKDLRIRELPTDSYPVILEEIHDMSRPLPGIVEPKPYDAEAAKAPAGSVVLFDGKNLDAWDGDWLLNDGMLQTGAKGNLSSKQKFADHKVHIEWRVVDAAKPGNSGVFLQGLYELQVFNSYQNKTKIYADGQAAAIYGQYPPKVNACRPQGEWEVYDIDFTAPRFGADGKLASPARISVTQNGYLVQDNVTLTGPTGHHTRPFYPTVTEGPLTLQHHGDRVQFRNIWVVPKVAAAAIEIGI